MGDDSRGTFFIVPHTHWEGAVFKTREEYLELGLPNILRALTLLKTQPDYRFVLDQACYVKPFLERYPTEEAALRQFVAEGRLAIVGGTDVMLDVNMPGGESFVRQVLYGKGYFRRRLGVDVTVGWQLDTFGHHAQMPQLLRLAGYRSFWFFRGVASWDTPSEFLWEGLDGSRIPAFWLAQTYVQLYGAPQTLPEFTEFVRERYEKLAPFAAGPDRVGLAGTDVGEPEAHVAPLAAELNRLPDMPFRVQLAVPADFEAITAQRPQLPVVTGEFNPIFQGTYSSRIELKQRTRELETLLTDAETLGALLRWLGAGTDEAALWGAWEPMLFNQAHDLMSGVMTDHVYEDTIRGYDFARRIAEDERQTRLQALTAHIDTRGANGQPVVVFNPLGWARTDLAVATVGCTALGMHGVAVIGPDGGEVPSQVLEAQRHADGALLAAKVMFVARDVPAIGHAVYHLQPTSSVPTAPDDGPAQPGAFELANGWYRLQLDPASGAISALSVNDGAWDALSGPANVVAMEADDGDLWELYRPLDGASRIAMANRHEPPQPGQAVFSTDPAAAEAGAVTRGPVMSEFSVMRPFGDKGRFQTTVRLYAGLRRIEIHTTILNQDTNVRYRALFPTSIGQGCAVHEIPFGASARPDGIEYPAQNWVDWGDGRRGVALLNRGLPGNNVAGGTMVLSLLRSSRIAAYGFHGGYEPGMGSDSGLQLGKELGFDYALVPHAGDWCEAGIHREGMAFNHPLLTVPADAHPGALPKRWGFLQITNPDVLVSALKPGADGSTVLRLYEATGRPATDVRLTVSAPVAAAEEVNLMEDAGRKLAPEGDTLRLELRPFEIKTLKLHVSSPGEQ